MHTEYLDVPGDNSSLVMDGDVFIPDPELGMKRTKSLVFREYVPVKTLGNGRYGLVKEAMHIKTGKHVAMKVISKSQLKPTELSALHTEISTLQLLSLSHPNIIHLYAHFTIANELYLIMDLCTGGELFDLICELGAFYEDDAQRIISVLLDAVAHLHENGIVHRDIKPENILIRTPVDIDHLAGENGNGNGTEKFVPKRDIVLADFGISKVLRPESKELLRTRIGSPGYMAPEVIKGEPYGSAVDVWAIGVIAYLLLSGTMPFQDDPMFDEMQNVMLGRYAFEPSEHWSQISDEAKDFIRTCLSPDPRDRPSARDALRHPWLNRTPATHADALLHSTTELHHAHPSTDLLPALSKTFSPKRRFRRVVHTVRMLNRLNLGHAEYADRMTKAGRYGMDSFSSDGNSHSNEGLRRGSMFTLGVGTQATERTLTPQDGVRHHVRGKSGSTIERTLTN